MRYIVNILFVLVSIGLYAQQEGDFSIERIHKVDDMLQIELKAIKGNGENLFTNLKKNDISIQEQYGSDINNISSEKINIEEKWDYYASNTKEEEVSIDFLVDVSQASDVEQAKLLLNEFLTKYRKNGSTCRISTFDRDFILKDKLLNADVISGLEGTTSAPDLFRVLQEQLYRSSELVDIDKRILFVIASGQNVPEGILYENGRLPTTQDDLVLQVSSLAEKSFYVYPIGIGVMPVDTLFKTIATQVKGKYSEASLPNLNTALSKDTLRHNYILRFTPENNIFRGESRIYTFSIGCHSDDDCYSDNITLQGLGSKFNWLILGESIDLKIQLIYLFIGIILITAILAICSLVVPVIRQEQFKKKYVQPYKQVGDVQKIDSYTTFPIQEGDLVVMKCQEVVALASWIDKQWSCPQYPSCTQNKFMECGGEGAPEDDGNFFGMNGIYRRLNWLWFGAIGGLLAWIFLRIAEYFEFATYLLQNVFSDIPLSLGVRTAVADAILGAMFAIGLIFMLSWVEERGQSRGLSWGRVLMRVVLGALITPVIFLVGFQLNITDFIPDAYRSYISGIFTWLLFGVVIGLVLSIRSSISAKRAVLGGLIASALALVIYWSMASLFTDTSLAQLFSLIVMGSILGVVLETVVASFEEFELEYVSPPQYRRTVPISKWLKSGLELIIGTASGVYVPIKWEHKIVKENHAKLSFEQGKVFITPYGETLLNGVILPAGIKTPLQDADMIRLGRESDTKLRLKGKQSVPTEEEAVEKKGKKKL